LKRPRSFVRVGEAGSPLRHHGGIAEIGAGGEITQEGRPVAGDVARTRNEFVHHNAGHVLQ